MNKFIVAILAFFPVLALADAGALSFTPPVSDYSVVFLSDIFGIVDGILHGTGSQIMGAMFAVFNAAVLALGGIVIMYTLMVSTMNTAHQGEMLGKQWSSIWIPLRATMGLALLIPKASGYCLMQIFVMWVVVQGVGAADKVWDAALSYLNRGGTIIQAQMNPTTALLAAGGSGVSTGAEVILAGQVCMLGLQTQLQNQLKEYQTQASAKSGPCSGAPTEAMLAFCGSSVPNFINSVNIVDTQNNNPTASTFSVTMPNFTQASEKAYFYLNGICGMLKWNAYPASSIATVQANVPSLSASDLKTASMSRSIAIQQMYMDLSAVAQILVGNDPLLGGASAQPVQPNANTGGLPPFAAQQLGVPQIASGTTCTNNQTPSCILWGADPTFTSAPLLNGTEFPGAIEDYNAIMLPTLTLVQQANNAQSAQSSRAFIADASTQGWIMAGSYFFNLVNLNVQANTTGNNLTDTNTGLQGSTFNAATITTPFSASGCEGIYQTLCEWFNKNPQSVSPIRTLLDGTDAKSSGLVAPLPNISGSTLRSTSTGINSLNVYGYINNSTILQLPNQPGLQPLMFAGAMNLTIDPAPYTLQSADFSCGSINLGLVSPCVGELFGNLFYNDIFRVMYNFFLQLFGQFINQAIMDFLEIPLQGMASIWAEGLKIIDTPGVNPVVALANMGTYYINFAGNLWIQLIEMSIVASLVPLFGIFIFALMMMAMPLLMAWLGIMLQIGFSTAYYVPILPYMIFTFGSIGWMMAVIEAMVAAPIVALGVTHPEGHDAFGKGEQAIMILMNVFLRPAMMIIGYITAIALTYVSVWIINAGFDNAIGFIQGSTQFATVTDQVQTQNAGTITGGYNNWAGIFAYFFSILVYTTMYLTVVQKSFTLISVLPDKVLRWIGGQPESYGQDTAQWGGDVQKQVEGAGEKTAAGQAQMDKQLTAAVSKATSKKGGGGGGGASSEGGKGGGGESSAPG